MDSQLPLFIFNATNVQGRTLRLSTYCSKFKHQTPELQKYYNIIVSLQRDSNPDNKGRVKTGKEKLNTLIFKNPNLHECNSLKKM